MRWFKVWGSGLQTNPKWLTLSLEQRGAWITLMTIASALEPAWRFESLSHACHLLRREGAGDPEGLIQALVQVRLLDLDEGGAVEVHDHEDWQRYPSDRPEATRERQQRSRAARAAVRPGPVTRGHERVTTGHDSKGRETQTSKIQTPHPPDDGSTFGITDRPQSLLSRLMEGGLDSELAATFEGVER